MIEYNQVTREQSCPLVSNQFLIDIIARFLFVIAITRLNVGTLYCPAIVSQARVAHHFGHMLFVINICDCNSYLTDNLA